MTSCYFCIIIFVIQKAKITKYILNKKAPATNTSATALVLYFLQAKISKYVYTTGLISYCFCITIFAIRKTKMANNLLDIKVFTTSIFASIFAAIPTLQY